MQREGGPCPWSPKFLLGGYSRTNLLCRHDLARGVRRWSGSTPNLACPDLISTRSCPKDKRSMGTDKIPARVRWVGDIPWSSAGLGSRTSPSNLCGDLELEKIHRCRCFFSSIPLWEVESLLLLQKLVPAPINYPPVIMGTLQTNVFDVTALK